MRPSDTRSEPRVKPLFQPLYLQIKEMLVSSLDTAEWRPGEVMPSEAELATRYGVSQGTVRKAVDALATDNLVVRRQGRGTFVATHTEENKSAFRFLRIRRNDGVDEHPVGRLLDVRRSKASAELARSLDVRVGDPTLVVRRVLEYSGEPAVLDEIVLPANLFKGFTRGKLEGYRGSMYGFFETQFGVRMVRAREKLRAVAADASVAGILKVRSGDPLLAVERVAFTYGSRPVEWRRGLCATRHHHYLNELG
jgi:GntR family transcriptional regulator